jgi:hypothetical protein
MNGAGRLGGAGANARNRHSLLRLCLVPVAYLVVWSTEIHNSGPINYMVQYHQIQRTVTVTNWQPNQIPSYRVTEIGGSGAVANEALIQNLYLDSLTGSVI